jgi:hypothetical protein
MIPGCHHGAVDKHDWNDLACFGVLAIVIAALWGGGLWLAFH